MTHKKLIASLPFEKQQETKNEINLQLYRQKKLINQINIYKSSLVTIIEINSEINQTKNEYKKTYCSNLIYSDMFSYPNPNYPHWNYGKSHINLNDFLTVYEYFVVF